MKVKRVKEFVMLDGQMQKLPAELTFRDFAALAKRRAWEPQFLAQKFRGKIEEPSDFFNRVLGGTRPDAVIPYRSVLEFYHAELSPLLAEHSVKLCICGCGSRTHGRKQYAKTACRKKLERQRSRTAQSGS